MLSSVNSSTEKKPSNLQLESSFYHGNFLEGKGIFISLFFKIAILCSAFILFNSLINKEFIKGIVHTGITAALFMCKTERDRALAELSLKAISKSLEHEVGNLSREVTTLEGLTQKLDGITKDQFKIQEFFRRFAKSGEALCEKFYEEFAQERRKLQEERLRIQRIFSNQCAINQKTLLNLKEKEQISSQQNGWSFWKSVL